jgi:aspartyl protease family protein
MNTLGKGMTIAAWVLAIGLLTLFFSGVLEREQNPNQDVQAALGVDGSRQVVLKRNRAGHYVASGKINGYPVVFLVDTGATDVAIPERIAERIGLSKGRRSISRTAGGDIVTWSTLLRHVDLGGIKLHTLRATILPDMLGDQVLLGMSFLKRLELLQKGDSLTLRLPR